MVIKNGGYYKTKRLREISKEIAKRLQEEKQINFEGLVIWIEFNIGLTSKKAREYIELTCKTHNWFLNKKGFITMEEES